MSPGFPPMMTFASGETLIVVSLPSFERILITTPMARMANSGIAAAMMRSRAGAGGGAASVTPAKTDSPESVGSRT